MASSKPFEILHGPLKIYVATVGTAFPAVNASPGGGWTLLGATDGDQEIEQTGDLEFFTTNDHQSHVKAVRPEEEIRIKFMVVGLTLENWATVLDRASDVTAAAGPPATKKIPLKRGYIPNEYALLLKGSALSPYGAFPGQFELPRTVVDQSGTAVFTKADRVGLESEWVVLEDDTQGDLAESLGRLIVQTA